MWAAVVEEPGMGPGRVPKVPAARAQITLTLCGPQPLAGSGAPACRRFYARVVTMDRPRPVTTSTATGRTLQQDHPQSARAQRLRQCGCVSDAIDCSQKR
jgi:hypothetical protein